jgi:hypothetical protein
MSEETNAKVLRDLIGVVESISKRLTLAQSELFATHAALFFALSVSPDRTRVARDLREMARQYEERAMPHPIPDQDIAATVRALVALAEKLE